MYSENNRRSANQRANDDFLRRMLGGELTGDGFPVMQVTPPNGGALSPSNMQQSTARVRCDGTRVPGGSNGGSADCPDCIPAPSIAMVYSPRQCWRNLFDPATALSKGSLFAELILPLEAVPSKHGKEVNTRRPM